MSALLEIILGNAVMAAALAALAALVGRACRRPALTHALWLLVLIKLVTPPLWTWRVPVGGDLAQALNLTPPRSSISASQAFTSPRAETDQVNSDAETEPSARSVTSKPGDSSALAGRERAAVIELPEPVRHALSLDARAEDLTTAPDATGAAPSTAGGMGGHWRQHRPGIGAILLCAAAGGSVLCALIVVVRLARFQRLLRYATLAPPEVRRRMESLAERMGVTPPSVRIVPGAVCPMVFALGGKPRLLIPAALWDRLDAVQQSALLVHELAHLHRRDHWVRWLEIVVTALYWWHPAVWWARHELREAEEQCCDAWVVWLLPGANRHYAAALLETLEFVSVPSPMAFSNALGSSPRKSLIRAKRPAVPAWASGMGQFDRLKRRLIMIKTAKVGRRLTWAGLTSVLALGGLLLPVTPGFGQVSNNKETPSVPVRDDKAASDKLAPESVPVAGDEAKVIQGLRSRPAPANELSRAKESKVLFKRSAVNGDGTDAVRADPVPLDVGAAVEVAAGDSNNTPPAAPGATPRDDSQQRGQELQDRDLQAARLEVQALSEKLKSATKRLADLEQKRAKAAFGAANQYGGWTSTTVGPQYSALGKPIDVTVNGGGYAVATPDGKVTVYSADGKIMSVTTVPQQPGSNKPLPGLSPASGQPMGVAPPIIVEKNPYATPPTVLGYAYGPSMPTTGGMKRAAELEDRLQKLEAQMQSLAQDMRNLHKEISASRAGQTDRPMPAPQGR